MTDPDNDKQQVAISEKDPVVSEVLDLSDETGMVEVQTDDFDHLEVRTAFANGGAVYYRASSKRRLGRSTSIV